MMRRAWWIVGIVVCVALVAWLLLGRARPNVRRGPAVGVGAVGEPRGVEPKRARDDAKQDFAIREVSERSSSDAAKFTVEVQGSPAPGKEITVRWRVVAKEDLWGVRVGLTKDLGVISERGKQYTPPDLEVGEEMTGSFTVKFADDGYRQRASVSADAFTKGGIRQWKESTSLVVNETGPVRVSNECLPRALGGPASCHGPHPTLLTAVASEPIVAGVEASIVVEATATQDLEDARGQIELPEGIELLEGGLDVTLSPMVQGEKSSRQIRVRVTTEETVHIVWRSVSPGGHWRGAEVHLVANENGRILTH